MRFRVRFLPKLSILVGLALGCSAYAQVTPPPAEAQVTFYSNAITLLGGIPGHDLGAFKGRIFDADHQLAFMEPAHFVTFGISPGIHVLTAASWMNSHAKLGAHLTLNVEPGKRYFVECGTSMAAFVQPFVIRNVPCVWAQEVSSKTRPLEAVHVRPEGKPILVSEISFPQCR